MSTRTTTPSDAPRGAVYAAMRDRLADLASRPSTAARNLEVARLERLLADADRIERGEAL